MDSASQTSLILACQSAAQDAPRFLFHGAAMPSGAEPKLCLQGVVEVSDSEHCH
jgi:hypothetical protein